MTKPIATPDKQVESLKDQVAALQHELELAKETERRRLADYQNLQRRQVDERSKTVKFATRELIEALLQPLNHLSLASAQLNDQGLNMVIGQFWQVLNQFGLEEIEVMGKTFDPHTMEVVDTQGEGTIVQKVISKGYRLNGEVIQVAKVATN